MKQEVTRIAKMLNSILTQQGTEIKINAVQQTLNDFETSTAKEMQRDFDNGDFSDMDDLSENVKTYQELKSQISNLSQFNKSEFKRSENKILKVYDYYESKYIRELEHRNSEQRKNYIETILSPLILISIFFEEKSK
jgi:hypothetical protein